MDTDINDDWVFLLYPLSINNINIDISIHIINVGMVGLNPQPTIIIKNIISIKLNELLSQYISLEMTRALTGAIGIVITIPISIAISLLLYKRRLVKW